MPSSPWHTLLIDQELQTCNSFVSFSHCTLQFPLRPQHGFQPSIWCYSQLWPLGGMLLFWITRRGVLGEWGRWQETQCWSDELELGWDLAEGLHHHHQPQAQKNKWITTKLFYFFYSLWYKYWSTNRNTTTPEKEGMREEERKRRLSHASVVTLFFKQTCFTKAWDTGGKEEV